MKARNYSAVLVRKDIRSKAAVLTGWGRLSWNIPREARGNELRRRQAFGGRTLAHVSNSDSDAPPDHKDFFSA
jgi:hypothetical protein